MAASCPGEVGWFLGGTGHYARRYRASWWFRRVTLKASGSLPAWFATLNVGASNGRAGADVRALPRGSRGDVTFLAMAASLLM